MQLLLMPEICVVGIRLKLFSIKCPDDIIIEQMHPGSVRHDMMDFKEQIDRFLRLIDSRMNHRFSDHPEGLFQVFRPHFEFRFAHFLNGKLQHFLRRNPLHQ